MSYVAFAEEKMRAEEIALREAMRSKRPKSALKRFFRKVMP